MTTNSGNAELIERLRTAQKEIVAANICGWGNVIEDAITALSQMPASQEPVAQVVKGRYGYTHPTDKHLFMAYCPEAGTEFFATQDEAESRAHDFIQDWREDGWGEDVDRVFVAQIISRSTQCDRVDKPTELDEEGCDGEGEYWDADWEYKCNYKLMPVAAPAEAKTKEQTP